MDDQARLTAKIDHARQVERVLRRLGWATVALGIIGAVACPAPPPTAPASTWASAPSVSRSRPKPPSSHPGKPAQPVTALTPRARQIDNSGPGCDVGQRCTRSLGSVPARASALLPGCCSPLFAPVVLLVQAAGATRVPRSTLDSSRLPYRSRSACQAASFSGRIR